MKYSIQKAELSHLPEVLAIEESFFSFPHTYEQFAGFVQSELHHFFVAVSEGPVLGYAEMSAVVDEGYISNVAVRPDAQRNGIANELIRRLQSEAENLNLSFISLEVRESNTSAIGLYSKNNFKKCGFIKNYYSLPKENAVIMTWNNPSHHSPEI